MVVPLFHWVLVVRQKPITRPMHVNSWDSCESLLKRNDHSEFAHFVGGWLWHIPPPLRTQVRMGRKFNAPTPLTAPQRSTRRCRVPPCVKKCTSWLKRILRYSWSFQIFIHSWSNSVLAGNSYPDRQGRWGDGGDAVTSVGWDGYSVNHHSQLVYHNVGQINPDSIAAVGKYEATIAHLSRWWPTPQSFSTRKVC